MGFINKLFGQKRPVTAEEHFQAFLRYAESNNVRQALLSLSEAASMGHVEALLRMGNLYQKGEVIAKDDGKAVECFRKAMAAGSVEAKCFLANSYSVGRGVEQNMEEALRLWKEAADAGDEDARVIYETESYYYYEMWFEAMDYFRGSNGLEQDVPRAIAMLERGYNEFCDSGALFLLGHIDIVGAPPYIPQNIEAGVAKMVKAAKEGENEAFIHLMGMFRHGRPYEGVPFEKNESRAGLYAVEIAEAVDESVNDMSWGEIYATAAWAYLHGHGVPENGKAARKFFDKIKPYHIRGFVEEVGNDLKQKGY